MKAHVANIRLRPQLLVYILLLAPFTSVLGQATGANKSNNNPSVSCSIRTDSTAWSPAKRASVYIKVINRSDTPLNIPLWSLLSLAPLSQGESLSIQLKDSGKIAAGIDPRALITLEPLSSVAPRNEKRDKSIRLRFNHKNEEANFKLDPRDLIWDYEAVSRQPVAKLFSIAKPGTYDAQFHMWWESGSCESTTMRLTISGGENKR